MAKAHKSDILGEWARENGFESIARAYPREVEKRRQQSIKSYNERQRKKEEQERRR